MSHRILEHRRHLYAPSLDALAILIGSPASFTLEHIGGAHAALHELWGRFDAGLPVTWSGRQWSRDELVELHLELLAEAERLGAQHIDGDSLDAVVGEVVKSFHEQTHESIDVEALVGSRPVMDQVSRWADVKRLGEQVKRDDTEDGYWQLAPGGGLKNLGRDRPDDMTSEPMPCMALIHEIGGRRRVKQLRSHDRRDGTASARELVEKEGGKVTMSVVVGKLDGRMVWRKLFSLTRAAVSGKKEAWGLTLLAQGTAVKEFIPELIKTEELAFRRGGIVTGKCPESFRPRGHGFVIPRSEAKRFPPLLDAIRDVNIKTIDLNPEAIAEAVKKIMSPSPFARARSAGLGMKITDGPMPIFIGDNEELVDPAEASTRLLESQDSIPGESSGKLIDSSHVMTANHHREAVSQAKRAMEAEQSAEQDLIVFGRFFRPAVFQRPAPDGQALTAASFLAPMTRASFPVLCSVLPKGARVQILCWKGMVQVLDSQGRDISAPLEPLLHVIDAWRFENGVTSAILDAIVTAHDDDGELLPAREAHRRLAAAEPLNAPMVANVLDILLLDGEDLHKLHAGERWMRLAGMRWSQAGELPNPREGALNVIPVEKVSTKGAMKRVLARLRFTRGSRGALVRSAISSYPLNGRASDGQRMMENTAVFRAKIIDRKDTGRSGEFLYTVGFETDPGALHESVESRDGCVVVANLIKSKKRFKNGAEVGLEVTGVSARIADGVIHSMELDSPRVVEPPARLKTSTLGDALFMAQNGQVLVELEGDACRLVSGQNEQTPRGFTGKDDPVEVVWSRRLELMTAMLRPSDRRRLVEALDMDPKELASGGIHAHELRRADGSTAADGAHRHVFLVHNDTPLAQGGTIPAGSLLFTREDGTHTHTLATEANHTEKTLGEDGGAHRHVVDLDGFDGLDFLTEEDGEHGHELMVSVSACDGLHRHRMSLTPDLIIESLLPGDVVRHIGLSGSELETAPSTRLAESLDLPAARAFVVQARFVGLHAHHDLRIERRDGICEGFTIFDCPPLPHPVASLSDARHVTEHHPGAIHWFLGAPLEGVERIAASPKPGHSPSWMEREGVEDSGAVVLRVDEGVVFDGFQSERLREFFFAGRKLKGRVVFRKAEQGWEMLIPDNQLPFVLGHEALEGGLVGEFGESFLPDEVAESIPPALRFWEHFDGARRREVRDELAVMLEKSGALELLHDTPFMNLIPQDVREIVGESRALSIIGQEGCAGSGCGRLDCLRCRNVSAPKQETKSVS